MPGPYRVAVVGLGVAGATTAYLLARDGHQVTAFDQCPDVGPIGAGILLQPSGQRVLQHLGILDQVTAHAAPLDELYARHDTGELLVNNRYPDFASGRRAYGIHRGVLFDALYRLVRSQPIAVKLGHALVDRAVAGKEVTLVDDAGGRHGPFDFVVAGDGSRSRLRQAFGFEAFVHQYRHGTLWLVVPGAGVPGRLLQVVRGTRKLFGLLPLGDGLVTVYWGLPLADYPRLKRRGLPALKREILDFAPESADALEHLRDFEQLIPTTYRHVWMRRRHDETAVFLGDAAHAMSPHLGQGANLAMIDAWHLAEALRDNPSPATAFRAFGETQRAYWRYYSAVTFFLSPFFQSDWAILGMGRDVALPFITQLPWVHRQMLMTVCGMKGDFLKGERPLVG